LRSNHDHDVRLERHVLHAAIAIAETSTAAIAIAETSTAAIAIAETSTAAIAIAENMLCVCVFFSHLACSTSITAASIAHACANWIFCSVGSTSLRVPNLKVMEQNLIRNSKMKTKNSIANNALLLYRKNMFRKYRGVS
jgi:hypothetical protein